MFTCMFSSRNFCPPLPQISNPFLRPCIVKKRLHKLLKYTICEEVVTVSIYGIVVHYTTYIGTQTCDRRGFSTCTITYGICHHFIPYTSLFCTIYGQTPMFTNQNKVYIRRMESRILWESCSFVFGCLCLFLLKESLSLDRYTFLFYQNHIKTASDAIMSPHPHVDDRVIMWQEI